MSDTGEIQPDERLNCCLQDRSGTVFPAMPAERLVSHTVSHFGFSHVGTALVAHQGGWDEILWVMVPIVVMVGLLRVATKRVKKSASTTGSDAGDVGAE